MDDFLKQDIFFFIATVAVVVLTLLLGALLVYLVRIARAVDEITKKVRSETDIILQEVRELRQSIRSEGLKARPFIRFVSNFFRKKN